MAALFAVNELLKLSPTLERTGLLAAVLPLAQAQPAVARQALYLLTQHTSIDDPLLPVIRQTIIQGLQSQHPDVLYGILLGLAKLAEDHPLRGATMDLVRGLEQHVNHDVQKAALALVEVGA